jgi:peptide/nickel transport system permease protein
LRWFVANEDGSSSFAPHVTGYKMEVDPASLRRTYVADESVIVPVSFFVQGGEYKMWGLFPASLHLVAPTNPSDTMYLLGTDRLGRDLLSRLIYGTRISMSIGLVGVCISLCLGVTLGSLAGFYGGAVDGLIARVIEVISSMPTIPLWLGLAAAIPLTWSPLTVYFVITLIVSLFGWTGLAREVRGRFFALRSEDFVTAARLDGSSERRLIFRHILPSLTSHILAVITLALPTMIVAETALSFLGVGLKAPIISWGVLLQEAQNVRTIANAPWQLVWPAGAVVITVLAYNFLGDGMRDAADPYES